jgi:membrane fusion protein
VALRYQAFPYQRFGSYQGRVAEISRSIVLPNETALPSPIAEPAYRVTVTLDSQFVQAYGRNLSLQAGMLLDASIWLERRRLYEWLLDPLYSLRGRV